MYTLLCSEGSKVVAMLKFNLKIIKKHSMNWFTEKDLDKWTGMQLSKNHKTLNEAQSWGPMNAISWEVDMGESLEYRSLKPAMGNIAGLWEKNKWIIFLIVGFW